MLKEDDDVLAKKIENPETGRDIKVSSALSYDKSEPVYKKALQLVKKSDKSNQPEQTEKSNNMPVTNDSENNSRVSYKKAGRVFGINKEIKEMLKAKGFPVLTAFPQTFVKPEEVIFNPKLNDKNKDSTWVVKFPIMDKADNIFLKQVYTPEFMNKSKVKIFKKISKIKTKDIDSLNEKTIKLLKNKNPKVSEAACVIRIVLKTGLRIGSLDTPDTGSIGTRTLQVQNIKLNGNKINFDFIGKSAQENIAEFEDASVASYLRKAMKNKKPTDRLFNVSYGQTANVMAKINPKHINPKDLRTYKGTDVGKNALQDPKFGPPLPISKDQKVLKKEVRAKLKRVFEHVANVLNNTPAMSKNSYVHPVVITDWIHSLGLKPKEVGYKHVLVKDAKLYPQEKQLIETSIHLLKMIKEKEIRKQSLTAILNIAQSKTRRKVKTFTEAINIIKTLNEAPDDQVNADGIKWSTMDELFEKYSDYGDDIDYSDISDDDSYDCEEFPIPDWYFDDNIELLPIQ